jgi:hypothetical protein
LGGKEEVSEKEDGTCKNGDNAKLTAMIAEDDAMFQNRRPCAMLAGTWRQRAPTPNRQKQSHKDVRKGEEGAEIYRMATVNMMTELKTAVAGPGALALKLDLYVHAALKRRYLYD